VEELSASGQAPEALSRFEQCGDILAWGTETRRAAAWAWSAVKAENCSNVSASA
jgi:hypothetical protein